jgi:hypothetical protein
MASAIVKMTPAEFWEGKTAETCRKVVTQYTAQCEAKKVMNVQRNIQGHDKINSLPGIYTPTASDNERILETFIGLLIPVVRDGVDAALPDVIEGKTGIVRIDCMSFAADLAELCIDNGTRKLDLLLARLAIMESVMRFVPGLCAKDTVPFVAPGSVDWSGVDMTLPVSMPSRGKAFAVVPELQKLMKDMLEEVFTSEMAAELDPHVYTEGNAFFSMEDHRSKPLMERKLFINISFGLAAEEQREKESVAEKARKAKQAAKNRMRKTAKCTTEFDEVGPRPSAYTLGKACGAGGGR